MVNIPVHYRAGWFVVRDGKALIDQIGYTAILMESFVANDGRPKSGVGIKDLQYMHLLKFINPVGLLHFFSSVSGLPCLAGRLATSDLIYYLSLNSG